MLLMAFVNSGWSGLGGEGQIEMQWLATTLPEHKDTHYELVIGHHPRAAMCLRLFAAILAFDVQVHRGVLQICSAGAGAAHRMPEGIEHLNCASIAIDDESGRYQVLDGDGTARKWLADMAVPVTEAWQCGRLPRGQAEELLFWPSPLGRQVRSPLFG